MRKDGSVQDSGHAFGVRRGEWANGARVDVVDLVDTVDLVDALLVGGCPCAVGASPLRHIAHSPFRLSYCANFRNTSASSWVPRLIASVDANSSGR